MAVVRTSKKYREKTIALLYGLPPDSPWQNWIDAGDKGDEQGLGAVHRRVALALEAENDKGYLRARSTFDKLLPKLITGALSRFQKDLAENLSYNSLRDALQAIESEEALAREKKEVG